MAEILGAVLNYLKIKAKEQNINIGEQGNYNDDEWYDYTLFQKFLDQIQKLKSKTLWTDLAKDLYSYSVDKKLIDSEDSPNNGIINIHKLYLQIIRGDNIGIWKTSVVQTGFAKIEENSVLPELFTKGILLGMLKHYNSIGHVVKQTKSRYIEEDNYFNEFELTWMKKIK